MWYQLFNLEPNLRFKAEQLGAVDGHSLLQMMSDHNLSSWGIKSQRQRRYLTSAVLNIREAANRAGSMQKGGPAPSPMTSTAPASSSSTAALAFMAGHALSRAGAEIELVVPQVSGMLPWPEAASSEVFSIHPCVAPVEDGGDNSSRPVHSASNSSSSSRNSSPTARSPTARSPTFQATDESPTGAFVFDTMSVLDNKLPRQSLSYCLVGEGATNAKVGLIFCTLRICISSPICASIKSQKSPLMSCYLILSHFGLPCTYHRHP